MLALLVAVVLASVGSSSGGTVGVGVLPGTGAATATVLTRPAGVLGAGGTVVVGPSAIPQYARTFGSFSGSLSGYIRDQWETRDGSYVRGGYTLVDADGSLVVVEYSSDPINGFRVVVKRRGFPDYFMDSILLGGPLPGGYLPPFYSDFGFDYSDDYYGYDFDTYYSGLGYGDFIPSYYSDYVYDTYAPSYLDLYDYDLDLDFDRRRRRSVGDQA